MGLFTKKKAPSDIANLHNLLHHSFKNVKQDTNYILGWLNHLYQRNLQQDQVIKKLKEQLDYAPKSKEDIKKIVDEFYSYEHILERIKALDSRIEDLRNSHLDLHKKHHEIAPKIDALSSKIESQEPKITHQIPTAEIDQLHQRLEKLEQKKATIKEKIIKRITKNSKDYIKSIILSYIKKYSKITALQLKEMVVEEQGLCSKSSFYRLLEELEEDPEIGVIKKGKEKHYIAKITKKNY